MKTNDTFLATDRVGRVSTWKLIERKDDLHYILEAAGETLKKYENQYLSKSYLKESDPRDVSEYGRIEVCNAWFEYRKIKVITKGCP